MSLKAYVASPYGFSEAGKVFYYGYLIPVIKDAGFEILDPWVLTNPDLIKQAQFAPEEKQKEEWARVNIVIGRNNENAIRACNILIGVLDGTEVDSGTAAEIGFAAGLLKPIEGYRSDFRLASDNPGTKVNLQVEHFITKDGGVISTNLLTLEKRLFGKHQELKRLKGE